MDTEKIKRLENLCKTTLIARQEWAGSESSRKQEKPKSDQTAERRRIEPEVHEEILGSASFNGAIRLFNGFYEGLPELVVDLYGHTLVLYGNIEDQETCQELLDQAQLVWRERLPNVTCVIQKMHRSVDPARRRGRVSYGGPPNDKIYELEAWYALDLLINQDASFYLDTRPLRSWLLQQADGKEILNTFAYTGSLGVAALKGGAKRVVQVDRNRNFLSLARRSAMLNRLDLGRMKLLGGDFFSQVGIFKREGAQFDIAILDPPYFAESRKGRVDLEHESSRLINKLRPLVKDGGWLVAINNALYLSGRDYLAMLEELCKDGYLSVEEMLPIPADVCGFAETILDQPPVDPKPFNHPTKIALLRVRKKS